MLSTKFRPHTKFDEHFRRHVVPRLINLTRAQAFLVQHEAEELHRRPPPHHGRGVRLGAAHMSGDKLLDLRDWVTDSLAEWIEAPPLAGSLGREQAARLFQSLSHLADTDDDDSEEEADRTRPRGND